jgi:hypothetical protein
MTFRKKHFYTWCAGLIVHALLTIYIVRNARYEPDAPFVKSFFFQRFITGRILWAKFALKSRGFGEIGKTSGDVKV